MPRPRLNPEEAKIKRQERNQRYHADIITTERNRVRNKLYQQRKREQARLRQHQDPLAQLADIVTQQEYLNAENEGDSTSIIIEPLEREEEVIDVTGIVEENGEVLENFYNDGWAEGLNDDVNDEPIGEFNDDYDDGFNDIDLDMKNNGIQWMIKGINNRAEGEGRRKNNSD